MFKKGIHWAVTAAQEVFLWGMPPDRIQGLELLRTVTEIKRHTMTIITGCRHALAYFDQCDELNLEGAEAVFGKSRVEVARDLETETLTLRLCEKQLTKIQNAMRKQDYPGWQIAFFAL